MWLKQPIKLGKFNAETKYKEKADEMLARVEQDLQNFTK
jgi:outer membrane protein assembly factor BamD